MPQIKELAPESVKQKRDIVQLWEIGHETTVYVTTKSGSVYLLKRGSSANNFTLKKPDGQSPFSFQETPLGDPIVKGNSIIGGRGEIPLGNTSEITEIEIENPEADEITPRIREIADLYCPPLRTESIQTETGEAIEGSTRTTVAKKTARNDLSTLRYRINEIFDRINEVNFDELTVNQFVDMIGTINTYLHDNLPSKRSSIMQRAYTTSTPTIKLLDGSVTISFDKVFESVQGTIRILNRSK